ncbi:MAG: hypothetical protein IJM44_03740 [Ruminococcus sp.]|nr:hypothetical protein [Ruminococcus sp.]
MELKDTIELMQSEDYKERFKAEFYQVRTRREKLIDLLDRWNKGELSFEPKCSFEMLCTQRDIMQAYLSILRERAKIEGIQL